MNKGQLASHAELTQWLINLGANSSLSTSVSPAQLVINQVGETPQNATQYFAQPHNDGNEYNPDDWECYMCTPEGAVFAQANPMLPEIGQALLALNQQVKEGKYGGGKAGRKGAGKIGKGKFQEKCWNCDDERVWQGCAKRRQEGVRQRRREIKHQQHHCLFRLLI